ncbi:MAG: class I SAM-dependent methyltransferase [Gemmataceae bacterium]
MNRRLVVFGAMLVGLYSLAAPLSGQEKSVRPGINSSFQNPNVKSFQERFEGESREIFKQRQEIVAACQLEHGMAVADVGAGTGLFSRLFAKAVGPKGKVYAVDITPNFVRHIEKTSQELGQKNVIGVVCTQTSSELPRNSVDVVFICDVYHHFEFPYKTMETIHAALKPGGRLVLIDFHRIEGKTSERLLKHVRAGQDVFTKEIVSCGFKVVEEKKLLTENYFVRFEKLELNPR